MKLGFTGTQLGMTEAQKARLELLLREHSSGEFHHGDCVGADAQAHTIATKVGFAIVIHPPRNVNKRAFCEGALRTEPPRPYLVRNALIVLNTDELVATPSTFEEVHRSGTWATIREAGRRSKKRTIIWPNGEIQVYE